MEDAAAERRADPLSWAVFAVLAVVYRWGRCPSFGPGDSPGLVYHALYAPGRDPLAWLGHVVSYLPLDTAEGQINALSGLFHAAAAALLFALLRRIGVKRVPALTAAALAAFARRYWYYALVAGSGPAVVFGLALAKWSGAAWKEEAKPWPLAFGALGVALMVLYAPRAVTLVPAAQWIGALLAGLLVQRLDLLSPWLSRAALAAALLPALLRPYDLRQHNPMLEYAEAAIESAGPGSRIYVSDGSIQDALNYVIRVSAINNPPDIVRLESSLVSDRPVFQEATSGWVIYGHTAPTPKGTLLELQNTLSDKTREKTPLAARAAQALEMPALTSVGRRDLAKYGFTGEGILYDRYRNLLGWYRDELGANEDVLRKKIDLQLADYGPGPGAKP